MNRFERPPINNQSKQAISLMLQARQRNPNSFVNNPQQITGLPFNMQPQARQQFMRAGIRNMNPSQMAASGSNPINNPMMSGGGMIQRQQQHQQQQSQMNPNMQTGKCRFAP